jgi:hypothetical protein
MGVWLQSKGGVFALRDGRGLGDPVVGVGPDQPTYLRNRQASHFLNDKDVAIIDRAAPPANYTAPLFTELEAERKARRAERAAEFQRAQAAKRAEKVAASKARADRGAHARTPSEDDEPAHAGSAPTPKKPKKPKAAELAKLDAEADKGEREVI